MYCVCSDFQTNLINKNMQRMSQNSLVHWWISRSRVVSTFCLLNSCCHQWLYKRKNMASLSNFLLYVSIILVIDFCNGLILQENCPSQVQSTLKMAESLDHLSKVLNQTINENLKLIPEKLIEVSSSRSGKSLQC